MMKGESIPAPIAITTRKPKMALTLFQSFSQFAFIFEKRDSGYHMSTHRCSISNRRTPASAPSPPISTQRMSEGELYDPVADVLRKQWARDLRFRSHVVE